MLGTRGHGGGPNGAKRDLWTTGHGEPRRELCHGRPPGRGDLGDPGTEAKGVPWTGARGCSGRGDSGEPGTCRDRGTGDSVTVSRGGTRDRCTGDPGRVGNGVARHGGLWRSLEGRTTG